MSEEKNDKLTIPKTIKVGYQERKDTYTGKLAYVIFTDTKGVLRKQKSWEGWRDKNINADDFKNEPTNGFVLNKDVGGAQRCYSWNARREKVRVYDPRNFEFEISVENLLFILQECSSIKGKGLEGEFVYSWAGAELVLLPVCSREYKNSLDFTSLQTQKVAKNDIKEGYSYITKQQEEVLYLGKMSYWSTVNRYNIKDSHGKENHFFLILNNKKQKLSENDINDSDYLIVQNFQKIAKKTSEDVLPQFAEEFDKLAKSHLVSKPISVFLSEEQLEYDKENTDWGRNVGVEKDGVIYFGYCYKPGYPSNSELKFSIECNTKIKVFDSGIVDFSRGDYENNRWNSDYFNRRDTIKGFWKGGYFDQSISYEDLIAIAHKVMFKHENGSVSYPD